MWREWWGRRAPVRADAVDIHLTPLPPEHLLWAVGSLCALHRVPFDPGLLLKAFPPPCSVGTLIQALRAMGLRAVWEPLSLHGALQNSGRPTLLLTEGPPAAVVLLAPGIADARTVICFEAGSSTPQRHALADFRPRYRGMACRVMSAEPLLTDPDGSSADGHVPLFGFRWFVPELLRHRLVWRDVLLASLLLQLLGLGLTA